MTVVADVQIAPSILSADFGALAAEVASVEEEADVIHFDVMDGHFVPNLTFGPPVAKSLRSHTDSYLDCHLMVTNPGELLEDFAAAGANRVTVHIEVGNTERLITQIRDLGLDVGLTLRPSTPFDAVRPYLDSIDLLLVMTVDPGFGGQKFMADQVTKVSEANDVLRAGEGNFVIQVDGGINPITVGHVAAAGARCFVAGSAIFGHQDRLAAARAIRVAAQAAIG